MIQVLLLILKIIGIILLTVLALLLVVLAAVLFVPICYRVRIIHNPEKTQVKAGISFLFPFVVATVQYFKKLSYKIRIFGFAVVDSEKPKSEKIPKQKTRKKPRKKAREKTKTEADASDMVPERRPQPETTVSAVSLQEEKSQTAEKKGLFEKVRSKIQKIRETISNSIKKIKRLFRQKEEAKRIFSKPETKKALQFAWEKLKHLLKHILPKKIKGYVAYGAGDPATTGQVLGILSIIYARTGQLLVIRPNFIEKQLESDVEIKGRIQVFTLLVITVKVFLNRELKQLITEVKGLKEIE